MITGHWQYYQPGVFKRTVVCFDVGIMTPATSGNIISLTGVDVECQLSLPATINIETGVTVEIVAPESRVLSPYITVEFLNV